MLGVALHQWGFTDLAEFLSCPNKERKTTNCMIQYIYKE